MFVWSIFMISMMFLVAGCSPFTASLGLALTSLVVGIMFLSFEVSWGFYTLVILFMGGMMVLFMYLCSLAVGVKMEVNMVKYFLILGVSLELIYFSKMNYEKSFFSSKSVANLFMYSSTASLIFVVIYLLLGLIVTMLLMKKFEGPMNFKH